MTKEIKGRERRAVREGLGQLPTSEISRAQFMADDELDCVHVEKISPYVSSIFR